MAVASSRASRMFFSMSGSSSQNMITVTLLCLEGLLQYLRQELLPLDRR